MFLSTYSKNSFLSFVKNLSQDNLCDKLLHHVCPYMNMNCKCAFAFWRTPTFTKPVLIKSFKVLISTQCLLSLLLGHIQNLVKHLRRSFLEKTVNFQPLTFSRKKLNLRCFTDVWKRFWIVDSILSLFNPFQFNVSFIYPHTTDLFRYTLTTLGNQGFTGDMGR